MAMPLTQARLKELLHYNPLSGQFTWIAAPGRSVRVGAIAGCKCSVTGYLKIRIDRRLYQAHRLAFLYMEGAFPPVQVDHIDRAKTNNAWANLRSVTDAENKRNMPRRRDNNTGATGVYWHNQLDKWTAQINVKGKTIHLGTFSKWFHAAVARKKAEIEFGYHERHGKIA